MPMSNEGKSITLAKQCGNGFATPYAHANMPGQLQTPAWQP
jgi:hypothetical protein